MEAHYHLLRLPRRIGRLPVYQYREEDPLQAISLANRIYQEAGVSCAAPLWKKPLTHRSSPAVIDPLYSALWHLFSDGQCQDPPGEDIAVLDAWRSTFGERSVIAVVDDGVELGHPDLAGNLLPVWHRDFIDNDDDPTAGMHGTAMAGLAAGRGFNGIGLAGVAPAASLLALRILPEQGGMADEFAEAAALGFSSAPVDIFNSSWGPPAGSAYAFERPSPLLRAAVESRIREGRGGLGSIYVWAAGNGGPQFDSNLDGYANSRHVVAVTATNCAGRAASYAQAGSNILISAPSGDGLIGLATTDRSGNLGFNTGLEAGEFAELDYTNSLSGTSGSAAIVSGVVALMLSVNDRLNWREVRQILAMSADRIDAGHPLWRTNGAGFWVNEQYGFGRVNAGRAVNLAANWHDPVGPEQTVRYSRNVERIIPDNDPQGVADTVSIAESLRIEHVAVTVDIPDHSYWGDLSIYLTSPAGTRVRLARQTFIDQAALGLGYRQWTLGDTLHLGENSRGDWTLEVVDNVRGDNGTFVSWSLDVFGTEMPSRFGQLPVSCDAISFSQPQSVVTQAVASGVSRHGSAFHGVTSGPDSEDYLLLAAIRDDVAVAGQLAVASYQPPTGGGVNWYALHDGGWQVWDGSALSLPIFSNAAGAVASLHAGHLVPGLYHVWSGFRTLDDEIYYCPDSLSIVVTDE
ncbi:MAG: S8 family serine peptidase [Desulfuromonadales bacterium]|nr:S8 family serine peptidase [Desulfuromonadales bacterium]